MFESSTAGIMAGLVLSALLALACFFDVRARRIPNVLVRTLAATGLAYALVHGPGTRGAVRALLSAILGLALWLPFSLSGKLGTGDVKLFAAASAWLEPGTCLRAALFAALLGGVLAIVWVMRQRIGAGRAEIGGGSDRQRGRVALPYGVAMAAGVAIVVWMPAAAGLGGMR